MNKKLAKLICCLIPVKKWRKIVRRKLYNFSIRGYRTVTPKLTKTEQLNMKKLKNIHMGKKCIIIGGAPSLSDLDLTKLNDSEYIIFTANRGYKLTEKGLNSSDYHFITDYTFIADFKDEVDTDFMKEFIISSNCKKDFIFDKKVSIISFYARNYCKKFYFCKDMTKRCHVGNTVVSPMMLMANYMGIKDITFIGVDLSFNKEENHFYKESDGEAKRCVNVSLRDKHVMYWWIEQATKALEGKGVKIRNASSAKESLDFMKKIDYNSLFEGK